MITLASVAIFLITSLNFTFGLISIPPLSSVTPDNKAAEIKPETEVNKPADDKKDSTEAKLDSGT